MFRRHAVNGGIPVEMEAPAASSESNISLGISRAGLAKYGQPYTPLEKISTVSVWMRQ